MYTFGIVHYIRGYAIQGKRTRNIHEDSIFYHHELSQLSSRESRKSRRRRVASPALVGVRRVFSAGWHTQALARVICEIREIRVKFNHLCVKILVRLPCNPSQQFESHLGHHVHRAQLAYVAVDVEVAVVDLCVGLLVEECLEEFMAYSSI